MRNYFNKNKDTIGLLLILIIFGSGLAIYGYNRINGVDLSKPTAVNFDDFELPAFQKVETGPEAELYFPNYYREDSVNETIDVIRQDLKGLTTLDNLFVEIITAQNSDYIAKIDCQRQCSSEDLESLRFNKNIKIDFKE